MRVKQLGNGGGFDFDQTNSSFLISNRTTYTVDDSKNDTETEFLLFDCGFSVMAELQKQEIDIAKINHVYISHMDEDHIGNLKMFIYWRYFMLDNKKTTVVCDFNLKDDLEDYLKDINKELIGCQSTPAEMFNIEVINKDSRREKGVWRIISTPTNHGGLTCHGIIISSEANKAVFISGDTKASKKIEDTVIDYEKINGKCLKFHDYSLWDCVTRNVHACETDYNIEYTPGFREDTIKYHTGLPFQGDWIEL